MKIENQKARLMMLDMKNKHFKTDFSTQVIEAVFNHHNGEKVFDY